MSFSLYQKHLEKGSYVGSGRGDFRFKKVDLKLIKDQTVIDLGCANGILAIESKKHGASKVLGVENHECIPDVRKSVREAGIDVEFWQVDIESPDFKNFCPAFDTVFFCSMLSHMHDPVGMLHWIDSHTRRALYFESNLGESNKAQIESVKLHTSLDAITFLGRSDVNKEGLRYMWVCKRSGKENMFKEWREAPVTFLPFEEVRGPSENACEIQKINPKYIAMRENIKRNGLMSPIMVTQVGDHRYNGREGGRRWCACKELGYKDIPCKIVPPGTPLEYS